MVETQNYAMINQKPYKLIEKIKETPDVYTFRFEAADNSRLNFDPGMFVMLTYIDKETKEKITRAFSIASAPNSDTVDFYIHMVHGRLTSKLENAEVGDIYYMSGPYGQFKFSSNEDKKVLFIAGGTGIAPFMSMLNKIKNDSLGTDIVLLYSVRYSNEIIKKDELEKLEKEINLKTIVTVTRPQENDDWKGEKWHICQEMVEKCVGNIAGRTAYICGPLQFVKAMKDMLIGMNMPLEKIKADVWG